VRLLNVAGAVRKVAVAIQMLCDGFSICSPAQRERNAIDETCSLARFFVHYQC